MFLSQIELNDFLSINGAIPIDVDRKVTILLGSNDHGKSNVLTAIEHLNDDVPITEEETNWDATTVPSISFVFSLTSRECEEWKGIVENIMKKAAEEAAEVTEDESEPSEAGPGNGQVTMAAGGAAAARPASPVTAKTAVHNEVVPSVELPKSALNPAATTLTLSRKGVGTPLQFEGVDIADLPGDMQTFFTEKKPRVELFRFISGSLQDSATETTITTDEYEFLQGVFFYADLDPQQNAHVFTQDDQTTRMLDNASAKLDANLRRLWAQGTDLHFELRHKGIAIEFLADDPAIKSRKARMSKRSSGVTQFFRVSMVLYARRRKNPANSYIYLFDEPGVFLHPQGQRDLMQVFEHLADENQIVYATHSLFLLNQNFPERHRLIYKDEAGTKVDQKPYRQNWKLATDALGVYLTSNILFSNRVLLVEGDSDPMYLYELLRQLNKSGDADVDLNALGIMSFYDYQNLRFLLQVFKREGQDTSLFVLVDGDVAGRAISQRVSQLCKRLDVPFERLPEGRSIEDYCLLEDEFVEAVKKTIQMACEAEGKAVPKDLEERIRKSWDEHKAPQRLKGVGDKPEKENGEEKKEKKTTGRWFKDITKEIIDDEASKVVLARIYTELCRGARTPSPNRERVKEAKTLCQEIAIKLSLPPVRAVQSIEVKS